MRTSIFFHATVVFAALSLAACTRSSVMPMSGDTIQITTHAALVCGGEGAQSAAFRRASIETINHGFDKFIILNSAAQTNTAVVGYTPVQANTVGSATVTGFGNQAQVQGHATTTYSGGQPIIAGSHDQGLIVKMFKADDPAGANAIPARETLGPDWPKLIKENAIGTCF